MENTAKGPDIIDLLEEQIHPCVTIGKKEFPYQFRAMDQLD